MQLACPHCHTRNRIDPARLDLAPTCGRCGKALLEGAPVELDDGSFAPLVQASPRPVVVDFWAGWCGPCTMFAPVFAQAAQQRTDFVFAKVDTDANGRISAQYAIRSIPTLAVFHRGRLLDRVSGALGASQLRQWLDRQRLAAA